MRGSEAPARVRIGAARREITKQFVVVADDRRRGGAIDRAGSVYRPMR
jgi:hypothetical protein